MKLIVSVHKVITGGANLNEKTIRVTEKQLLFNGRNACFGYSGVYNEPRERNGEHQ